MPGKSVSSKSVRPIDERNQRTLSRLRKTDALGIFASDLHLSHKAPIARSAESDWYAAMERPLAELKDLANELNCGPVVVAGDIFDRWNAPAELINFAIDVMPAVYAVPGQHDLAHHSLDDIAKTAYWTLVKAGKITNIRNVRKIGGLKLWGFPWGDKLGSVGEPDKTCLDVAVVHRYCWTKGKTYPGASGDGLWSRLARELGGFGAACFGDNHKGFIESNENTNDEPSVMNCGTFMRRKADEISYEPMVGILTKDGEWHPYYLDTTKDQFIDVDQALALVEEGVDMAEFLAELGGLADKGANFVEAVSRFCKDNGIDSRVQSIINRHLHK